MAKRYCTRALITIRKGGKYDQLLQSLLAEDHGETWVLVQDIEVYAEGLDLKSCKRSAKAKASEWEDAISVELLNGYEHFRQ